MKSNNLEPRRMQAANFTHIMFSKTNVTLYLFPKKEKKKNVPIDHKKLEFFPVPPTKTF